VTSCPACGEEIDERSAFRGSDRLHGTPGEWTVAVCRACGSGRTLPLVASHELGRFYPTGYDAHALPANAVLRVLATLLFETRWRRALRREPFSALRKRPGGRLLDVGSGRGDAGIVLRRAGWEVTGLEPSADAAAEAQQRGVQAEIGTLTDGVERAGGYDAVLFNHSLEHVVEPLDDLGVARSLLRPGGLLLVSVPNFGSWQARRFGSRWFHLDLPRHRSHFTSRGLERLLRRAGFAGLRTSTSTSADGLPMSVHYRLLGRRRFTEGVGRYGVVAATLAVSPLSVAANAIAREGDLLHAVGEKPRAGE
jgi:SAM-dependent methyltransferase